MREVLSPLEVRRLLGWRLGPESGMGIRIRYCFRRHRQLQSHRNRFGRGEKVASASFDLRELGGTVLTFWQHLPLVRQHSPERQYSIAVLNTRVRASGEGGSLPLGRHVWPRVGL
jgi:hypothetical protein